MGKPVSKEEIIIAQTSNGPIEANASMDKKWMKSDFLMVIMIIQLTIIILYIMWKDYNKRMKKRIIQRISNQAEGVRPTTLKMTV